MIFRANNHTKRICLRIRHNGSLNCCEEMALRITPLVCEKPLEYCYYRTACGTLVREEKVSEPVLTLVYDMFDRNEHGDTCFLLDSNFAGLPCGRYNAVVVACGCEIYTFQIDKREQVKVSQVIMDNRNNCCEGKYGC